MTSTDVTILVKKSYPRTKDLIYKTLLEQVVKHLYDEGRLFTDTEAKDSMWGTRDSNRKCLICKHKIKRNEYHLILFKGKRHMCVVCADKSRKGLLTQPKMSEEEYQALCARIRDQHLVEEI